MVNWGLCFFCVIIDLVCELFFGEIISLVFIDVFCSFFTVSVLLFVRFVCRFYFAFANARGSFTLCLWLCFFPCVILICFSVFFDEMMFLFFATFVLQFFIVTFLSFTWLIWYRCVVCFVFGVYGNNRVGLRFPPAVSGSFFFFFNAKYRWLLFLLVPPHTPNHVYSRPSVPHRAYFHTPPHHLTYSHPPHPSASIPAYSYTFSGG